MKRFWKVATWAFAAVAPILLPLSVVKWGTCHICDIKCPCTWMPVVGCVVVAFIIGHVLMILFWCSFQERKPEKVAVGRMPTLLTDEEVKEIRDFLGRTFSGVLELETNYRFPNGFQGDLVALHGRGRYPIMCFEVISGDDSEQKIQEAIQELRYISGPLAGLTQCFILKKFRDGMFQLLKVRGANAQIVDSFDSNLRNEIEQTADRVIGDAKRARLKYPILFLLWVVTPIMESIAILSYFDFPISSAVSTLLVFWIGAFLGIFGVRVKGYEPTVSDLMNQSRQEVV